LRIFYPITASLQSAIALDSFLEGLFRGELLVVSTTGHDSEWWHFTLKDEPFPDTYFTFPVKQL
jgi:hypothetical protein